jgi:hypothetical protein
LEHRLDFGAILKKKNPAKRFFFALFALFVAQGSARNSCSAALCFELTAQVDIKGEKGFFGNPD